MNGIEELGWTHEDLAREYRLVRVLGEADGLVRVLAHDLRLDRPVLLVLLARARSSEQPGQCTEAFVSSMRLLARVGHTGVRSVHGAHARGELAFAALEHVEGEPLAGRLARGPVPRREAIHYGLELLDALEASHARGVAHPALSADSVVQQDARLVLDGVGAVPADAGTERAGLDAVARIVYQAVTGRPWQPAQAAGEAFAAVPYGLRSVLRRALAPDPGARWPDAASFRRALVSARSRAALAPALLLLAVLGVVGARWYGTRLSPSPPPPSNELAVLPLDAADSLGPALAHLLSLTLNDVPGLTMTSSRRIEHWSAGHGGELEGVQRLAPRELGVRWAAHGLVTRNADSLRVRLTLYPWKGAKVSLPEVGGTVQDLAGLGERLSLPILEVVAPELEPRVGKLRDFVGVPFPALKAFLQGEAAFDRDAWTVARENYQAAIDADPDFALASWRLANVKRWERLPYDFFADLHRIDEHFGDRLRPADRAVIQALLEPDVDRRLDRLDSIVSHSRPDAYVQYLYAEELFHRGPLVGHDIGLAVRAMERTVALDSSFAEAYNHLFAADLRAGRPADARRMLDLRRRIAVDAWPGDLDKVRLMELAYDERFVPWRGRLKRLWLEHSNDSATLASAARVARLGAPWFDIPATQAALCGILFEHGATDSARAGARNGIAIGLMTLGRPSEALAQLDSSIVASPSPEARLQRIEWEVVPRLVGLPVGTAKPGPAWREALEDALADPRDAALAPRIRWALAAAHLSTGDTAAFLAEAANLETLAPGSPLGVLLRAVGAGARGDPARALAISDSVRGTMSVNHPPDPFAGSLYHLLRADWHMALHDHRAADREWRWVDGSDFDRWPIGVVQAGEIDAAFGVYARWRRADAALASARTAVDSAAACAMLRRVVELWRESESVMRPLQAAAARRVQACPA